MDKWNELGKKQERFTEMVGELFAFAKCHGIKLRIKDAYRDPRLHGEWGDKAGYGAAYSCHKVGLAIDLFTTNVGNHKLLHNFWDSIGGAPRIPGDLNHYSLEWQGFY